MKRKGKPLSDNEMKILADAKHNHRIEIYKIMRGSDTYIKSDLKRYSKIFAVFIAVTYTLWHLPYSAMNNLTDYMILPMSYFLLTFGFALMLIIFNEEIADYSGRFYRIGPKVTSNTPASLVSVCGWFVLIFVMLYPYIEYWYLSSIEF